MQRSIVVILAFLMFVISCQTKKAVQSPSSVLFSIDNSPTYSDEFFYVYTKNNYNNDSIKDREEILKYLDLYINFKLKVKEAEEEGHHLTQSFKDEFEGYRKQLAQPYLTENSVTEKLVLEAYERLKEEINASHILVQVAQGASPEDTLKAYDKATSIREKALSGNDFEELARKYSEDPSVSKNGGSLGYFTSLQMVYPFEDAAYKTPVGTISELIRTRFGYHIIKVNDRRTSQGKVKVSHIMIRATEGITTNDSIAAQKKISEIHQKLKSGANWEELVSQFSEDLSSKGNGGSIAWFGTGNMVPTFEIAAFALQQKGDISEPVKTPYGWHIIKMEDKEGLEPFEALEATIKSKVSRDSRSELNKTVFLKRLKNENSFIENEGALSILLQKADSSFIQGKFSFEENNSEFATALFTIGNDQYTIKDFIKYVSANPKPGNIKPVQYLSTLYSKFVEKSLIEYEEAHLEEKYEDYKMLVKEYRDGILLFQMMDEKVWSKALNDDLGLQKYFDDNKEKYFWESRANAVVLGGESKDVVEKAFNFVKEGKLLLADNGSKKLVFSEENNELSKPSEEALKEIIARLYDDQDLMIKVILAHSKSSKERKNKILDYFMLKGIDENRVMIDFDDQEGEGQSNLIQICYNLKKSLEMKFNLESALTLQIKQGMFEKGQDPILAKVEWQQGNYSLTDEGRHFKVIINDILPSETKKLNETRGLVISDYQNHLEKLWVNSLKNKYSVKINDKELDKTILKIEKY